MLHISGAGGSRGVCGCTPTPQQGAEVDTLIPRLPELASSTCVTGYLTYFGEHNCQELRLF